VLTDVLQQDSTWLSDVQY